MNKFYRFIEGDLATVTEIHPQDACYYRAAELVGQEVVVVKYYEMLYDDKGGEPWHAAELRFNVESGNSQPSFDLVLSRVRLDWVG